MTVANYGRIPENMEKKSGQEERTMEENERSQSRPSWQVHMESKRRTSG